MRAHRREPRHAPGKALRYRDRWGAAAGRPSPRHLEQSPASPSLAPVSPASRPPRPAQAGYDVPSTTASAIPRWKPPTPTAASCRPATPRSGTTPPPCSGSALAGPQQRAAAAQSALQLAQVFLAAAIHAPDPQPPPQHHRHHPAGDRGLPAPVRHSRGRRHRLRPGAARHPHIYHDAASFEAARRGNELLREAAWNATRSRPRRLATSSRRCKRPATPASTRRPTPPATSTSSRAGWPRPASDWACASCRTPTSPRSRPTARATRWTWPARTAATTGTRPTPWWSAPARPADASRDSWATRSTSIRSGLFDQRAPGRRRQPRGRAAPPARRGRQDRHQPAGRPLPRGRHRRVQRLQPGHPRRTRAAAGGLDPPPLPRRQDGARGALVRAAPDDAGHDAARGSGKRPGVFYNTGHGHLGWTLSAATAQLLAASVGERLRPH